MLAPELKRVPVRLVVRMSQRLDKFMRGSCPPLPLKLLGSTAVNLGRAPSRHPPS